MAALNATRSGQYVLESEFTFDIAAGDTLTNTAGNVIAFNGNSATVFDAIKLPLNATVVGGDVTVEVASNDASTATIAVGDSASATRYLGATNMKAAARTALVPTGYRGQAEDIRLTLANAGGAATTGKVTVRVLWIMANRANEVFPN
jgi:hypothetical protein